MRRQCPECKTVTGGHAGYCGSCGCAFTAQDAVRAMAATQKPKKQYGIAVLAGLAVALLQYEFLR